RAANASREFRDSENLRRLREKISSCRRVGQMSPSCGLILLVRDSSQPSHKATAWQATSLGMTSGECAASHLSSAVGDRRCKTSKLGHRSALDSLAGGGIIGALMNIRVVFCVIVCGLVLAFVGRGVVDRR